MTKKFLLPLFVFILFGIVLRLTLVAKRNENVFAQSTTNDWPMVGHDSAHTGKASETLGTNFSVVWTHPFQPEKLYPQVQTIIYTGSDSMRRAYIGTEMGNLYAFNAMTGAQSWKFSAGGQILSSVLAYNGTIFLANMDGNLYALNAVSGSLLWKKQLSVFKGLSASPILADGKVIVGGRNGILYAIDPANGAILWQFDSTSPILQTPAANNGKIYFGANNMYFYAINSSTGAQVWKSARMNSMGLKDYWPVVTNGLVFVRAITYGNEKNFYAFNESTGIDMAGTNLTQYTGQTMNGGTAPPCIDGGNQLVVPNPVGGYPGGWARMSPSSPFSLTQISNSNPEQGGSGNPDENLAISCSNNLILVMHFMEQNANYTGAYNLNTNSWTPKILPGATKNEMSTNTQGGGTNPASISNGYFYHTMYHELIARRAQ